MAEFAFLLDLGRCISCEACVSACKTGNKLAPKEQYIKLTTEVAGVFPDLVGNTRNHRCYHCTDAACVQVCPTSALFKEDGLTRLDTDVCSGCGYCVDACPFEIPQMVDGRATKCDGCRDVVKVGGTPWCVKTCPSQALRYDTREAVLADAHRRVETLKVHHPNAQVYGATQAGGLGVVVVMPDDPESVRLPIDPQVPLFAKTWQNVVQPGSLALTAGVAVIAGTAAVVARRNHLAELRELEAATTTSPGEGQR